MLTMSLSGSYGTFITSGASTSRLLGPSAIVLPSGSAFSMALSPIDPVAPARFSMITGRPVSTDICCPTTRAAMSMVPPGGAGTMILKGLSPIAQTLSANDHPINTMAERANCCSFIFVSRSSDLRRCRQYLAHRPPVLAYLGHKFVNLGKKNRLHIGGRSRYKHSSQRPRLESRMSDLPSLATLAARVGAALRERGQTVAVTESSAGGLVSAALLAIPGASAFFVGGAVVYTRRAGRALLGLTPGDVAGMRGETEPYAALVAHRIRGQLR